MAKIKIVYILINHNDGNEYVSGTYQTLQDAKNEASEGDVIYEVSGKWDVSTKIEFNKVDLILN